MEFEVEWAGVRFLPVYPHDARFFRSPGLFALVHRGARDHRTLLYVGHTDNIAAALDGGSPVRTEALRLGLNALNVAPHVIERVDRLVLAGHIMRRCSPILNLLTEEDEEHVADSIRSEHERHAFAGRR